MTLQPGHTIEGKYRIVRLLGKGAMGAVYEGENERIRRRVAIKILHSDVSHNADVVQRFEREAQAAGRIGSAHIVEVLDLGNLFTGERFMVMEYLDGESLGARIKKQERLTLQEFAPMLHQLLEGLASAHEAGIVHRDLKPDNIYLVTAKNQQNFVKILDFGVSKFTAGTGENDLAKTNTGMILGTPYYMSPEQVRAESLDARSDIYSAGVIMYQAVTGKLPFRASKFTELAMKITVAMYDPPESVMPGLDPQFAALIAKAMHHDRKQRFQTTREFQAAIEQWMATNSVPAYQRLGTIQSMPPTNLQLDGRGSQPHGPVSGPSRSSISGGVVVSQQQLSSTHFTPMGTSNLGLGLSPPAPAPVSNGLMIAVGLFGTLFLAVCAVLVYTFVIDQPANATPAQTASVTVAAATTPPPLVTQTAALQTPPSTTPSSSADAAPASIENADTPTTSKTSRPSSGSTTATTTTKTKTTTAPPTGGRKMTGEL